MKSTSRPAAYLLLVLGSFLVAPVQARGERCPQAPEEPVALGETLRLGDSAYRLHLEAHQPEGAKDWNKLEVRLDLVVRSFDPSTREMGPNTQPLTVSGNWSWTDGVVEPVTGGLAQRMSSGGTALGFDILLQRPILSDFVVTFEVEPAERKNQCAASELRFAVTSADIEASVMPSGQNAAIRAPSDNHHMTLISQIDLRATEPTSDVWGYNNGVTYLALQGQLNGTIFVDVTDPFNPVEVGFVAGPTSDWRDIKTYQNYAYVVTEGGAGPQTGMQIIDLSDPFNPTLVNTYSTNFTTTHNVWIDEDRGHAWLVGTNNGTRIVDLADPVNPVEIGSWSTRYVHDVYVKNNLAYLSEIANGIHEIADATDPANLQILSSWSTPNNLTHNSWPNEDFSLLITSDEDNPGGYLTVYDINDVNSTAPKLSEYVAKPSAVIHNVIFDDIPGANRAVMSYYALGVRYIDLQRPTMPVELGSYDTRSSSDSGYSGCWGVYPFDPRGYIYASDIQSGLFVLELAPTGGALTGIVRDSVTQTGVAGASIQVQNILQGFATNLKGEFGIYAPAGEVVIQVMAPGYQSKTVVAGSMTIEGGVDVEIDLVPLPTTTIVGSVLRASDLTPIPGAVVSVVDSSMSAVTTGAGLFSIANVGIGQRILSVDQDGFSGDESTILLSSGEIANVVFELHEAPLVDDLEVNSGWTVDPLDTATTGRWTRADPIGTGLGTIQPDNDHTPAPGVRAYFTGQGIDDERADPELADVDGGTTSLLSPVLDLSALSNPTFSYFRWFSTEVGSLTGGSMRVEVSDDAGFSWTTVELLNTEANSWTQVQVAPGDYVNLNDQFRVRFACEGIAAMDQQRILECAVDDIEINQECRARLVPGGADSDFDGRLDPCDACPNDPLDDVDGDGLCADLDNAPFEANPAQTDGDSDGIGDVVDNCVATSNADQFDLDRDGQGDACDLDRDGDGIANGVDPDNDNDGTPDASDLCPTVPDGVQADFDADTQGDACDVDDDLVHGVRIDDDLVSWQPESGATTYNLYRANLGSPQLIALGDCRASNLSDTAYVDTQLPEMGSSWAYLITAVVSGIEQGLGFESGGTPRQINTQCP